MKNPFKNRKKEAVIAHREVPKDFLDMTTREQLEWCGQLLEGLVPLREDDPDGD
jgi:hypothetical protein